MRSRQMPAQFIDGDLVVEDSENELDDDSAIIPEMQSVIMTVTGYVGAERAKLIRIINGIGAIFVGDLHRGHTHLVCWKFSGGKYNLAKKRGLCIVNHRWVEDCLKTKTRLPEAPYAFKSGQEVGPIQCDVKNRVSHLKLYPPKPQEEDLESVTSFFEKLDASSFTKSSGLRKSSGKDSRKDKKAQKRKAKDLNTERIDQSNILDDIQLSRKRKKASCIEVHDDKQSPEPTNPVRPASPLEDIVCVICQNEYESDAEGLLSCGHSFCFGCITKWARQTATCPLCKQPFDFITKREAVTSLECEGFFSEAPLPYSESIIMVTGTGRDTCKGSAGAGGSSGWWCIVCRGRDAEEMLMVCRTCGQRAAHTFCLDPPLSNVSASWMCNLCMQHVRYRFK